jgi:hypothetical protein
MMNWTNGRYVSNLHRVVNRKAKARMSLPHFANADYDAIIAPIPALIEPGSDPITGPIHFGRTWTTSTRVRCLCETLVPGHAHLPAQAARVGSTNRPSRRISVPFGGKAHLPAGEVEMTRRGPIHPGAPAEIDVAEGALVFKDAARRHRYTGIEAQRGMGDPAQASGPPSSPASVSAAPPPARRRCL